VERFEMTLEVGPIGPGVVERLKADGFLVFRGKGSWRVQRMYPVLSEGTVRAQAHALALDIVDRYGLTTLSDPPAIGLRSPDVGLDERPDLLLSDTHQSYDPAPRPRAKRKWYQRVMELGLGERKGD